MLRTAQPEDLAAIRDLYAQLHRGDAPLSDADARRIFEDILADPKLTLFVFEPDRRIVGSVYLNVIPNLTRGGRPYAVLENVVVDSGSRRGGVGAAMLAATLQIAWDAGCYKVMLSTGREDPGVHAFYRACGFSADEKQAFVARPATPGAHSPRACNSVPGPKQTRDEE